MCAPDAAHAAHTSAARSHRPAHAYLCTHPGRGSLRPVVLRKLGRRVLEADVDRIRRPDLRLQLGLPRLRRRKDCVHQRLAPVAPGYVSMNFWPS
eukprot:249360-Prymnesium_polylepis.1